MLLIVWKVMAQYDSSPHDFVFTFVANEVKCWSELSVCENDDYCLEYELPKKPGPGKQGRSVRLRSNFYEVACFLDEIIHYDVNVSDGRTDDIFPRDLNLSVIEELVRLNQHIFQKRPVYDGRKNLYSVDKLPFTSKVSANNALKLFT